MNFRNLLVAGAFVAMLGFAACNENPTDVVTGGPSAPTGLMASTQGPGSVKLTWTAPTGATSYRVTWVNSNDATNKGTLDSLGSTTTTVSGLETGREYTFTVAGINTDGVGTAATIKWAAANRFVNDAGDNTVSIRLYEFASSKGSGLILDPANGGPKNVRTATGSGTTFGNVNLAIYTDRKGGVGSNTFDIGPAYAFPEFANSNSFDHNTYVSRTTFNVASLNEWYLANSLDKYISLDSGNISTFDKLGATTDGKGQGFIVRTGVSPNFHYARVFVKSVGGTMLQGSAGNRFVELEISYQSTNVPYAKTVAGKDSPIGIRATYNR